MESLVPHRERYLELLGGPQLAGLLGISPDAFRRKRRDLPLPLRIGARRFWLRREVGHLHPSREDSDMVMAPELASLLFCSVDSIYRLVKRGTVIHSSV